MKWEGRLAGARRPVLLSHAPRVDFSAFRPWRRDQLALETLNKCFKTSPERQRQAEAPVADAPGLF